MTEEELLKLTRELGIARDQILREETEMEVLNIIANDKLSRDLVFYGGTALRLAYNSPRFSEDLDFVAKAEIDFTTFKKLLAKIAAELPAGKIIDCTNKRQTMFALLHIRDSKLKHPYSLKIEIHKPKETIKFATQLLLLQSPTAVYRPLLLTPTLAELRRLKEAALSDRQKARDLFDLWFIARAERTIFSSPALMQKFSRRDFVNDLQKFLPRSYWPVITELYEQTHQKN